MNCTLDIFAVAAGGSVGAVARYLITALMTRPSVDAFLASVSGPLGGGVALGTTVANVVGCFLLGLLFQSTEIMASAEQTIFSPRTLLAIRVGLLGSLTTFSTLVGESVVLGQNERVTAGGTLVVTNLIVGGLLFVVGMAAARTWVTA